MGEKSKRGKVWLAVAGIVQSKDGSWLVVKKKYGGLKGKWSFPAGFVEYGETMDEAVIREVKEETGIDCKVRGIIGVRTGVIQHDISDNLVLFYLQAKEDKIVVQESELSEVVFLSSEDLNRDEDTSILVKYIIQQGFVNLIQEQGKMNPGEHFGYTTYKVFF